MIKLNTFPFKTLKTAPKVSDNKSTSLLLQGGYIRQAMAGAYEFLPMGYRVLRNIENIIREEMDNAGYHEMLMTILTPKALWEKTGRWDIEDYFKVPGHWNAEYRIAPTNEENVTPIMSEFIQSYKDLPTCVYQIQKKFRNEKRAKSGLLRGREFTMKDAYSFHKDIEDFEVFYEWAKKVYTKIFERLGLWKDTFIANADGWDISDKDSHEFQVRINIWEDYIYRDTVSWICYNQELAPSKVWKEFNNSTENLKTRTDVLWKWLIWVNALAKFLNIEVERTTKTILFTDENDKVIAVALRWDYEINTIKLKNILWCKTLELLSENRVKEVTWSVVWYAGMIWLSDEVIKIWDDSCENRVNFEMWANKENYHSINVNFWKDIELPENFYDIKEAKTWDKNPETNSVYDSFKASEIWNIFHLWEKYTKAFWVKYLDENNKNVDRVEMWCYGIWVSRAMWIMAEYFMTEKWIAWPKEVAPATYYIIVIWEDNIEKATEIAKKLEKNWETVILDDRMWRKAGFGQKAGDCELYWIPNRIVISPKTLEKGGYELKKRGEEEEIVSIGIDF